MTLKDPPHRRARKPEFNFSNSTEIPPECLAETNPLRGNLDGEVPPPYALSNGSRRPCAPVAQLDRAVVS